MNRIGSTYRIILFLLLGCLAFAGQAQQLSSGVKPVKWDRSATQPSEEGFEGEVVRLMRNSNRFALNTWYRDIKKFASQPDYYLNLGGTAEHYVRPVSHQAFALAVALRLGVYSPDVAGVPADTAVYVTKRLIGSLASAHKANTSGKAWGDQWQSALWAGQAALAGWMMWDDLTPEIREMVCRMMVHEADRFLNYKIPYYRDPQGKIIYKGDSKSEENAWNTNVMVQAAVMMPGHPHARQWMQKAIDLQLSAYSMPSDLTNRRKVNGVRVCDLLAGSNIEEDGTVINHGIVHADYMCAIMHNAVNVWICGLAGVKGQQASLFNGEKVYHALTDLPFGEGKTMYVRDSEGKATSQMFFPQGNDWGTGRQDGYWVMDMIADIFGWDARSSVKAADWAAVRNRKMLEMQGRSSTGQYYADRSENSFPSREEWYAAQIAFGYLGMWEKKNNMIHITNKKY